MTLPKVRMSKHLPASALSTIAQFCTDRATAIAQSPYCLTSSDVSGIITVLLPQLVHRYGLASVSDAVDDCLMQIQLFDPHEAGQYGKEKAT